jgi:hypothetical protein
VTKRVRSLGEPCWSTASAEAAISSLAVLDQQRSHYFLSSHAPIRNMRDRHGESVDEEQLYQRLFGTGRREVLGVVSGNPGTGKSHLINWLKLRCDRDLLAKKLQNVTTVLIHRRSGTLRDALTQLVEQLGSPMRRYLGDLENAIIKVSDATARQLFINSLQIELGPRRADRERQLLPRELRELNALCLSQGFRTWLCRDGGTVAEIVRQLSEHHNVRELGDKLPEFRTSDFNPDARYRPDNTPLVRALMDELDDDISMRELTARAFNEAVPDAIREMTGLGGSKLRDIFDNIRVELHKQGKKLALFIEDVSVLKVLETEILNAVEPQAGRSDLCDLVAVLGMVEPAYKGLRDNQKDRITEIVSLEAATKAWAENRDDMARFTARYLNTMRLTDDEVRELADARRQSGDITISACSGCNVREACHKTFGKVDFAGIDVGVFPFTHDAPFKLLTSHKDQMRKTPRGFLMDILEPLTKDTDALVSREFPRRKLPVERTPLSYGVVFENKFCAGWQEPDRIRIRILAEKWITAGTPDEAAQLLKPFLTPLGFDPFSSRVVTTEPKPETTPTKAEPSKPSPDPKYAQLQRFLEAWRDGGELKKDPEFRELLADFLRGAVSWDDASVPSSEYRRHILSGYEFINIEAMTSRINKSFFSIWFPRDKNTYELLVALLKFAYEGKNSWSFPHSEVYKRVVHRWIRHNETAVLESLSPQVDSTLPIETAAQYLALVAVLRSRKPLSGTVFELMSALWEETAEPLPVVLGDKLKQIVKEMPVRSSNAREFLFSELDVPQGTGGTKFINPLPVLLLAEKLRRLSGIPELEQAYFTGFWNTRYHRLRSLNAYTSLKQIIETERTELKDLLGAFDGILEGFEYDEADAKVALSTLAKELNQFMAAAKQSSLSHADSGFEQDALKQLTQGANIWATSRERLKTTLKGSLTDVLTSDPADMNAAVVVLRQAEDYVEEIEKELRKQEAHYSGARQAEAYARAIQEHLETIIESPSRAAKKAK